MQVSPVGLSPALAPAGTGGRQEDRGVSFNETLNNALEKLNELQVRADQVTLDLLTGEIQDLHQVTVAMQEAKLTMQLAVEVRNRAIEAYQEVSRMQV